MPGMQAPTPQTESPYELGRKLENVIRRGTVHAVRGKPAAVRVQSGDNITNWLPWLALRAGGVEGGRMWDAPVEGEQCVILSQGGDLAQGVVLVGLPSDAMPDGSDILGHVRRDFDETDYWEWLRGAFTLFCMEAITLTVADTCRLHMTPDALQINVGSAQLLITEEQITSNVDVVAKGISLVEHKHEGVTAGRDETGKPVQ